MCSYKLVIGELLEMNIDMTLSMYSFLNMLVV